MKNRKQRIARIIELISNRCIGSQAELAAILTQEGYDVTQATLSRDLRMLHITKVSSPKGGYTYVLPGEDLAKAHRLLEGTTRDGVSKPIPSVALAFSGNIAVMTAQPKLAGRLASLLNRHPDPRILGAFAAPNRVFVIMSEDCSRSEASALFQAALGIDFISDSTVS